MIAAGYTDQEIHSLFRNQPDYNEKKTQYFIEHARKRGYKPFTVQKILEAVGGANVG
jgi:DNA primase large subunit